MTTKNSVTTIEIWGDSHLDEIAGIGARHALTYENNFRETTKILENNAKAGSYLLQWLSQCAAKTENHADIVVVSTGFNDAVMIAYGLLTPQQVRTSWELFASIAKTRNQKVLWVPTNFMHGRAPEEFPATEILHLLPHCLGVEVLNWNPTAEQMCPDRVHYTYETYFLLAQQIFDTVETFSNPHVSNETAETDKNLEVTTDNG